jgi:hypothetical protein
MSGVPPPPPGGPPSLPKLGSYAPPPVNLGSMPIPPPPPPFQPSIPQATFVKSANISTLPETVSVNNTANNSPDKSPNRKDDRRGSSIPKKVTMNFQKFEEIIQKVPKRIKKAPTEDYEARKLNLEKKAIEQMRQK